MAELIRSAVISYDGVYRYELGRQWGHGPVATWIMLNPSTADADVDDPTIRRVIGFSRAWGMASCHVVNLFALRATDPRELRRHPDPVGPANDAAIERYAAGAELVVAAWGVHGVLLDRARKVRRLLADVDVRCLGRTKGGHPRHPLYVAAATELGGLS